MIALKSCKNLVECVRQKCKSRYVVHNLIIYVRLSVCDSCCYCGTYFTLYLDSDTCSSTIAQFYAGIDNLSCFIIFFFAIPCFSTFLLIHLYHSCQHCVVDLAV